MEELGVTKEVINTRGKHIIIVYSRFRNTCQYTSSSFFFSLNLSDRNGDTALILASKSGNESVVRTLLEYNADIKIRSRQGGEQAIHKTAVRGNLAAMKEIVKKHPEAIHAKDTAGNGFTPLMTAKYYDKYNIIEWLTNEMGMKK